MLHNIAGNVEMYGVLDRIASGPVDTRQSENSTMASVYILILLVPSRYYQLLTYSTRFCSHRINHLVSFLENILAAFISASSHWPLVSFILLPIIFALIFFKFSEKNIDGKLHESSIL